MWSLILKQESPKDAANVGRSYPEKLRSDWEFAKCLKMYEIVKAKVIQNPDVYLTLISTEGKRIFETNPNDNYWGIGANKNGKNVLGKIYECIRGDIK